MSSTASIRSGYGPASGESGRNPSPSRPGWIVPRPIQRSDAEEVGIFMRSAGHSSIARHAGNPAAGACWKADNSRVILC